MRKNEYNTFDNYLPKDLQLRNENDYNYSLSSPVPLSQSPRKDIICSESNSDMHMYDSPPCEQNQMNYSFKSSNFSNSNSYSAANDLLLRPMTFNSANPFNSEINDVSPAFPPFSNSSNTANFNYANLPNSANSAYSANSANSDNYYVPDKQFKSPPVPPEVQSSKYKENSEDLMQNNAPKASTRIMAPSKKAAIAKTPVANKRPNQLPIIVEAMENEEPQSEVKKSEEAQETPKLKTVIISYEKAVKAVNDLKFTQIQADIDECSKIENSVTKLKRERKSWISFKDVNERTKLFSIVDNLLDIQGIMLIR